VVVLQQALAETQELQILAVAVVEVLVLVLLMSQVLVKAEAVLS
jgi:hypothetical protein